MFSDEVSVVPIADFESIQSESIEKAGDVEKNFGQVAKLFECLETAIDVASKLRKTVYQKLTILSLLSAANFGRFISENERRMLTVEL